MASTGAHKRSKFLAAAVLALLLACLLAARPLPAKASSAGGTQAAGGNTSTPKSTSAPTGATKASPHVTSVRIERVACLPVVHCSGNPHQVSTHGTLLLEIGRAHV